MYNVTIFGIDLNLDPVAFELPIFGGWSVYWYGVIIASGFLLAIVYAVFNAKRFGVNLDRLIDVVLVATPVSVLGARLYYIIFDPELTLADFFSFDSGGFSGLAIYGGVIGAFLAGGLMCLVRKLKILDVFDLAAIGFLIGQGVGRWGNFVNQEAFGAATGSDWFGMTSEAVAAELGEGVLAHPCFLYESIWCLLGVLVLHLISRHRRFSGQIILCYGVWYGFGRGFIELLRTDSLYIGNIRVSSMLSFMLCIASAAALIAIGRRTARKGEESSYVPLFEDAAAADSAAQVADTAQIQQGAEELSLDDAPETEPNHKPEETGIKEDDVRRKESEI